MTKKRKRGRNVKTDQPDLKVSLPKKVEPGADKTVPVDHVRTEDVPAVRKERFFFEPPSTRKNDILKWLISSGLAEKNDRAHVIPYDTRVRLSNGDSVVLWEWLVAEGFYDGEDIDGYRVRISKEDDAGITFIDVLHSSVVPCDLQAPSVPVDPLRKPAFATRENTPGPDHPEVAIDLSRLANTYSARGQYTRAEQLCKRALAIREKAFGPDHVDVAASLNDLANVYRAQGRHAQADPFYAHTLALKMNALGPRHADDGLHSTQSQYMQAEALYKRALAILDHAPDAPQLPLVRCLNDLAELHKLQGQYAQAVLLLQRALATSEAALGPDDLDVATCLNNLAALYYAQRQYAPAEQLFERALAVRTKALGPAHPAVVETQNHLAALRRTMARENGPCDPAPASPSAPVPDLSDSKSQA